MQVTVRHEGAGWEADSDTASTIWEELPEANSAATNPPGKLGQRREHTRRTGGKTQMGRPSSCTNRGFTAEERVPSQGTEKILEILVFCVGKPADLGALGAVWGKKLQNGLSRGRFARCTRTKARMSSVCGGLEI